MSTIAIQGPIARPRTRLRLTARGRRVLLALAAAPLAAGIAFSALAGGSALASGEQAYRASFETVTVMPGDTLWSIAAHVAPDADPRDVVDDIIRLNNLPGGMVQAGSEIAIPAAYAD
ncbi:MULTISPECIES: LysM peptidoglycan-binding domain-containing protein [Microbacterium]|uniref:LysM peptidoglycan-binding domain-containing protein n=1 Tax=Microbacterium TaxID=33882 RepID=UPI00217DC0E0|nr:MULTISPECIES: LysM peptidoglycan-binding domain-containing protein [Microbacterium]UWF76867.1 LysM peptidoglycan-binding domain-containing protein [Microbacterium neungamense]WCM55023.1 LysM peptidoglycan-binding domain-containing protein [Microbacterium sp. EF45047]